MTELQKLKKKCLTDKGVPRQDASKADLARMKQLQDAEPVSAADIATAEKREAEQHEKEVADFNARQQEKSSTVTAGVCGAPAPQPADPALDKTAQQEHPRIKTLKGALLVFTQLEVDPSRDDAFVLINRGTAITAGDVRKARTAMSV